MAWQGALLPTLRELVPCAAQAAVRWGNSRPARAWASAGFLVALTKGSAMRRAQAGSIALFLLLLVAVDASKDRGYAVRVPGAAAAGRGKPVRRPAPAAQPPDESGAALAGALPTVLGRPSPAVP